MKLLNELSLKFYKDSFIFTTSTLFGGFLGYLYHFIVSRNLSVSAYGELQSLISATAILGITVTALSYFITKHVSVFAENADLGATYEFTRKLSSRLKKGAFVFLVIFLLAAPLIKQYLHLSDYFGIFIVGLIIFSSIVSVIYRGVISGWRDFIFLSKLSIAVSCLKLILGFTLSFLYPRASVVILAILVPNLLDWFLSACFATKKYLKKQINPSDWEKKYFTIDKIKKNILPILAFSGLIIIIQNIDVVVVKNIVSSEIAGYYAAMSILGKIIFWVNSGVISVVLPNAFASEHSGNEMDRRLVLGSHGIVITIGIIATIFYYLFPSFSINLLFGAKYSVFAGSLWLFGVMGFLLSLVSLEATLAFAKAQYKINLWLALMCISAVVFLYTFHKNITEIITVIAANLLVFTIIISIFRYLKRNDKYERNNNFDRQKINICCNTDL